MSEEKIPDLPTREKELEYLKWLEKSIRSDPWITVTPKRYMAGPQRLRYKKKVEMKREYRKTFLKNALIGIGVLYPLTV